MGFFLARCMVCGETRPDELTAVVQRLSPHQPPDWMVRRTGQLMFYVTYCIDRLGCITYAHAEGPWVGPPRREPKAADDPGDGPPQETADPT